MMKIFQIWVDFGLARPPVRSLEAMRDNAALADEYLLIAESNFLGVPGFLEYQEVEREALADFRVRSMFAKKNAWNSIDVLRTWFLIHHPEYIYVDVDARLLLPLPARMGPAFARAQEGYLDGFVAQGGNDGAFFDHMLDRMYAQHPTQCFPQLASIPQSGVGVIEPRYFQHFGDHS